MQCARSAKFRTLAMSLTRPLLKGGPTGLGGGVGGWVRGLWVGGLVWFWAIWPNVPTPPQGGGGGLGGWVGGWVGNWVGAG